MSLPDWPIINSRREPQRTVEALRLSVAALRFLNAQMEYELTRCSEILRAALEVQDPSIHSDQTKK
jgi:hypothetical protein